MIDTFNPTSYSTIDLHMDFSIKLLVLAEVAGFEPANAGVWQAAKDLNLNL